MCENSSGYLDDGEALISIYPKPGTALVLELFSHVRCKTILFCVELRHVTLVIFFVCRELAIQIHNEARKFAQGSMIKSVVAYGGTSVFYQASQLQRGCNILVATPGRLLSLLLPDCTLPCAGCSTS